MFYGHGEGEEGYEAEFQGLFGVECGEVWGCWLIGRLACYGLIERVGELTLIFFPRSPGKYLEES